MPEPFVLDLPDLDATRRLGRWLGERARTGDALLLSGDLGAGKTSLAQGIADGLGIDEPVTSPTFTLLNEYKGRLRFFHFDFYRLEPDEIPSLGLEEYWFEPRGVVAIEWPERLDASLRPDDRLAVTLAHAGDGRTATLTPQGPMAERWLSEVRSLAARH
jgi:tRNA threonylcarbamoyladenosine biosynthesis protein TsaE